MAAVLDFDPVLLPTATIWPVAMLGDHAFQSHSAKAQSCTSSLCFFPFSAITHHRDGLFTPIEVRSHVGAAVVAGGTAETRLNVGEPGIIRPAIAADRNRMAAAIVTQCWQSRALAPFEGERVSAPN
jgi:hypothetical protein